MLILRVIRMRRYTSVVICEARNYLIWINISVVANDKLWKCNYWISLTCESFDNPPDMWKRRCTVEWWNKTSPGCFFGTKEDGSTIPTNYKISRTSFWWHIFLVQPKGPFTFSNRVGAFRCPPWCGRSLPLRFCNLDIVWCRLWDDTEKIRYVIFHHFVCFNFNRFTKTIPVGIFKWPTWDTGRGEQCLGERKMENNREVIAKTRVAIDCKLKPGDQLRRRHNQVK